MRKAVNIISVLILLICTNEFLNYIRSGYFPEESTVSESVNEDNEYDQYYQNNELYSSGESSESKNDAKEVAEITTDDLKLYLDLKEQKDFVIEEKCSVPDSYVFLKKHKVGSTTLKTVFGNFEDYAGIQGELPLIGPQGGCYPARINQDCWPSSGRLEHPKGMRYHFRWNPDLTNKLFLNSTPKFTSIREPISCFRSVYDYFYFKIKKLNPVCDMPCWNYPYYEMLGNQKNVSIHEFLERLPSIFNTDINRNFRAKNYQSFELGFDHLNDDDEYIEEMIQIIDEQFDLIIITEYYLESMVLLKHILCVPYEVLYVKTRNKGSYVVEPLSEIQKTNFNMFFKQDILMYNYFNKTLHQKIEDFGFDRMESEIMKMREIWRKCAINKSHNSNCSYSKKPMIKEKKIHIPKLNAEKFIKLMDENYGWCSNPNHPYNKAKEINRTGSYNVTCPWTDDYITKNFKMNP